MAWYTGPTLLEVLETVPVNHPKNHFADFRFPVQNIVRPDSDFRGYAGQIVSGTVKPGQEVMALPSGRRTRVDQIIFFKEMLPEAIPLQSVVLTLQDHIDLGRGDMLVDPERLPVVSSRFVATLIWMSADRLSRSIPYLIRHATQLLCCKVAD